MRIAVVSSPRSGNTWIRMMLAGLMDWHQFAVHDFKDLPPDLPADCFVQLHWHPEPAFMAWLKGNRFRVLTIARHPLDVLLSAVTFAQRDASVLNWLGGRTGLPIDMSARGPADPAFRRYCLSAGAAELLSVSDQWLSVPNLLRLKYEAVVDNPHAALGPIIAALGGEPARLDTWLENVSLTYMRSTPTQHGWRGKPGHWTELIASTDAVRIYWRHRSMFQRLGYGLHPAYLSRRRAEANWHALAPAAAAA
jgi:hypothetical protein